MGNTSGRQYSRTKYQFSHTEKVECSEENDGGWLIVEKNNPPYDHDTLDQDPHIKKMYQLLSELISEVDDTDEDGEWEHI